MVCPSVGGKGHCEEVMEKYESWRSRGERKGSSLLIEIWKRSTTELHRIFLLLLFFFLLGLPLCQGPKTFPPFFISLYRPNSSSEEKTGRALILRKLFLYFSRDLFSCRLFILFSFTHGSFLSTTSSPVTAGGRESDTRLGKSAKTDVFLLSLCYWSSVFILRNIV